MKSYPSILSYRKCESHYEDFCIAFDKKDGSNIRVEWDRRLSKKSRFTNGFKKYGTRTQIIQNTNEPFGVVPDMFMEKYSENLDRVFNTEKIFRGVDTITVFLEFFGENSFAGLHDPKDIKDIVLFDVFMYKKDFVKPTDFIELFHSYDIPKVIYSGPFNQNLIRSVQDNDFKLKEGVVAKGVNNNNIWMAKIKTNEWLHKVKNKLGNERFNEEL